ncbi:MAG TPA: HU family DNA-binding protein [Actinomycetota bacterium]
MNKKDLVEDISVQLDVPASTVAEVVDAVIDNVTDAVVKGDKVVLSGFGTFQRQPRAARTARNIWTGQSVKVRARDIPSFKPGKPFFEAVTRRRRPAAPKAKRRGSRSR